MEKLSDKVIEEIKDFEYDNLTDEQESLINRLILNENLKKCYKEYGLCEECQQPNTGSEWCQSCKAKSFEQNFTNWASGNDNVDKFIQKLQLKAKNSNEAIEWFEYDTFEDIEFVAIGGFGTIYKAKRERSSVALKSLHNSQDITAQFLNEIEPLIIINDMVNVVQFYGMTKDPNTNNFMMVMDYVEDGNLRQYLDKNFKIMNWVNKLYILKKIAKVLKNIHNSGLIHNNLHCGNLLNNINETKNIPIITDLGIYQPANQKLAGNDKKQVYGVLPYVAPEALKGKERTQASDIYSFGIIAYEITTGLPPYFDCAHEELLAMRICQGLRPKSQYKVPQKIMDIIKQCLDADPLKRPNSLKLYKNIMELYLDLDDKNSVFNKQSKEADESNKKLSAISSTEDHPMYKAHPQAVYISRPLDFNKLPETKNANNVEFEAGYSEKGKVNVTNASSNQRFSSPVSSSPRIRTESNPQQTNIKDHENWVAKQQERISILQKNVELQKHLRELSLNNDDHEKWMEQQQQRIDIYQRQIEFQKQLNELYLAIPQLTNDEEYEKWMERQQERIRVLKEQVDLQQQLYDLSNANMNYY